jgi:hypothetical protein
LQIHQRIVHRLTSIDLADASAQFKRLRHPETTDFLAFVGARRRG